MKTIEVMVYVFEPGQKIRTEGPSGPEVWHILAAVEGHVMLKKWWRRKNRWYYFVENDYFLTLQIDNGKATLD